MPRHRRCAVAVQFAGFGVETLAGVGEWSESGALTVGRVAEFADCQEILTGAEVRGGGRSRC